MVSKTTVYVLALTPVVFCLSYILLEAYTGGDQIHYRNLYEALSNAPLSEMPTILQVIVSSSEPLTGLILWGGAHAGIEKTFFISSLNVLLVSGVFILARRHKAPGLIIFLLLTNFYLIVLLTAAERLKIAYIFLTFSALFVGNVRFTLLLASPFAHLQSLIIMASILTAYIGGAFRITLLQLIKLKFFPILLTGLIMLWVLWDGAMRKATIYEELFIARGAYYTELTKITLLLFGALLITHHRLRIVLALFPLFVATMLFGDTRINMIAVTVVFYLLLTERRLNHPLVYALMGYMSLKSITFLYNILVYGDGFQNHPELINWSFIFV